MARGSSLLRCWFLIAVAVGVAGCQDARTAVPAFLGADITGAGFGRDFHLADQNGRFRTLADFRGKVVLLTFGYTHCPDICPATLANLASAMERLGAEGGQVQVLFVTLDPGRDKPDLLGRYVSAFNRGFLALSGGDAATATTAGAFRVHYQRHEDGSAAGYSLDHGAGIFAFDRGGQLRLLIGHDASPSDIAHDVRLLLAG